MKMTPQLHALIAAAKDAVEACLRNLHGEDAEATLSAVPDLVERIPYPIAGPNLVGVFYLTIDEARQARARQYKGLGPFPALMTTNLATKVAVDVAAPNFMFAGNRADGLVLRILPDASMTIWRHHQLFLHKRKKIAYEIALAFVLGLPTGEGPDSLGPRFDSLIKHTVSVWCGIRAGGRQ
jgi:hypothetical protein